MDTLRALSVSEVALTEEVTVCANATLMAVEGRVREPEPAGEGDDDEAGEHIMVSYQWDVSIKWAADLYMSLNSVRVCWH